MKKVYLVLALIIIVAIMSAFFVFNQKARIPVVENKIETKVITEKNDTFDITAQYPQFALASIEFNKKIADLVNNQITDFKKNSQDNLKAFMDTATEEEKKNNPWVPFMFDCGWTQALANENYISFKLDIYYFSGGAHGANQTFAYNYDIKKQREITIQDLLGNSQDNLKKLADVAQKVTIEQLKSFDVFVQSMAEEGTAPTSENYKNFNFDNKDLIIYFEQYQVAPGAAGPITIKIPLSQISFLKF